MWNCGNAKMSAKGRQAMCAAAGCSLHQLCAALAPSWGPASSLTGSLLQRLQ